LARKLKSISSNAGGWFAMMNFDGLKVNMDTGNLIQDIVVALDKLEIQLHRARIGGRYYSPKSLDRFLKLDLESQIQIRSQILHKLDLFLELENLKIDISDNIKVLMYWLKRNGMHTFNSFISEVGPKDIIEIYDQSGTPAYKSIQLFNSCNYDFLDVEIHAWAQLFERDTRLSSELNKFVKQVIMNPAGTLITKLPPYFAKEKFSNQKKELEVTNKAFAPVFIGSDVFGVVSNQTMSSDLN
jgi:hypothetical protein